MKTQMSSTSLSALMTFTVTIALGLVTTFMATNLGAAEKEADEVAKAIVVRGQVSVTLPDGDEIQLKEGAWLPQGASISTAQRSFAKFLFIDRSQMNLAPNSEMTIEAFSETDPGMINLMRGRLRSKVTRNYLDTEDESEDSKLFIKTKNAAMGVRGTDFLVSHNPAQDTTGLVTFQGSVAMSRVDNVDSIRDPRALDAQLNSDRAVRVTQGQASTVRRGSEASPPRQVDPSQIERINNDPSLNMDDDEELVSSADEQTDDLAQQTENEEVEETEEIASEADTEEEVEVVAETESESESSADTASEGEQQEGQTRSRIPPGMDEETFTSNSEGLEEMVGEDVASRSQNYDEAERAPASIEDSMANTATTPERETDSFYQADNDIDTATYIEDTLREQEEFIQESTEEAVQESHTRVRFLLTRDE